MNLSASDLRGSIAIADVIERYALRAKRRGSQYRVKECPRCHAVTKEAVAIDAESGSWLHHGAERAAGGICSGDVFELIAACEGLDCTRDFRRIVEIAASIAGADDPIAHEIRVREAKERARQLAVAELERRLSNRSTAAERWNALPRRDDRGAAYLASRNLDPDFLISVDAVRFDRDGVVVAIRDADGCPISTATRRYEGEPKVLALRDHSTRGTFVDALRDIRHDRDAVVTEGVIDSLTARHAWPTAIILGANGAGAIARIVEAAIPRLKLSRARLVLVPHADERGVAACATAARIAIAAGLEIDDRLSFIDLEHKDLNEAWGAGWRS